MNFFTQDPDKIVKLAGNTCWGRSGSYLMCRLFEGHPQILSLPPHIYGSLLLRTPEILKRREKLSLEAFIDEILGVFPCATKQGNIREPWSLINAAGSFVRKLGNDDILEMGPEEEKFKKVLREILENCEKQKMDVKSIIKTSKNIQIRIKSLKLLLKEVKRQAINYRNLIRETCTTPVETPGLLEI